MTNEEVWATARQWLHAKTRYENTTPIRGKPHIKPLGNRRKHHETVELFDAEKQIYSYKLYDTHWLQYLTYAYLLRCAPPYHDDSYVY